MLLSMTGYGQGVAADGQRSCTIEIRALNSRGIDLFIKIPALLKGYEQDIRKILSDKLVRGKAEVSVFWQDVEMPQTSLDLEKIAAYWSVLESFANDNQIIPSDRLLAAILQMPDIANNGIAIAGEAEWKICESALNEAIDAALSFRDREGKVLQEDILLQLSVIAQHLEAIAPLESARIPRIRERIVQHAAELLQSATLNPDRLEQEMVLYIEKLDISEEKVRLKMHLEYFREVCLSTSTDAGKKLGFISQELGREINTIGSKANDAAIQKLVIQMKDALEKIKEQVNNIL